MTSNPACRWLVLLFGLTLSQTPYVQADELPEQLVRRIERRIERLREKHGIPGLSAAIAQDQQLVYNSAFGLADVEHSVPATNATRYRTASIAKPMTAAVILSLVEDGKVDLDADVRTYVEDFPAKRWTVTSRQLLGHLGGIRHYRSAAEATSTAHFFSLDSALDTFKNDRLIHQPGTRYRYSSFGYNLLGSIAERAAGKSFPQLLRTHVLEPARMSDTLVDNHFAVIPHRARGYIRATAELLKRMPNDHDFVPGRLYRSTLHDTSMKIPGGGLLSTASDLARFAMAVHSHELLNPQSVQLMWTRQRLTGGAETSYGLGWSVGQRSGRQAVWHGGGQSGTSTMLLLLPETGTCVTLMCNLQGVSLLGTAAAIADLVEPPPEIDYAPAIARLKAAVEFEVRDKRLPAFSISLVDRDRMVWAEGFGHQDARGTIPATARTVYRVGSVSKLFTDIAVLQLVDEGRLNLDAPVQTYLPEFRPHNPHGVPLTLRQLMSHQSGLVRESPVGHYFDPDEPSLTETVASLNRTSLVYPPQTRTKYSNAAIAVVGAVLEQQLETTHPERVRQSLLNPLGMTDSDFEVTDRVAPRLATGWMRTYDGRRFVAPNFLLGTGPAGNLYSSVTDLSKFVSCLFNDGATAESQVIQPDSLELMTTPVRTADGTPQGFGLGFHIRDLDGTTQIGHGGAVYGFSTQLEALPERRLGVVAAAALDGTNGVVGRLTEYALRLMIAVQDGESLPDYPQSGPVPPERARELVGAYRELEGDRTVHINELDGDVTMRLGTLQRRLRTAARDGAVVTDDAFGYGTAIELENADQVRVGDVVYQRLPDEPPAEIPAHWRGLIGEYGWDHNVLYILEQDGRLYALIEWFFYYPLEEISPDVYQFPDFGLYHGERLKFTRDAQGLATEVVAAEVRFERRPVGTREGETFKITPVRPLDQLRAEALAASPPREGGEFRDAELVDVTAVEPTLKLDIRYATTNNFMGAVFYRQPRAFLQKPAAAALARAQQRLAERGLGLLIHDAYRPWHVTKMFWDATPDELKDFVANPANGSRHNRGCAVDLTLFARDTGRPIPMVAGYDEFSPRSSPGYPGGTSRQRWYRDLLRRTLESEDFHVYEFEWWHFDYKDWKQYRIGNATFEQLDQAQKP